MSDDECKAIEKECVEKVRNALKVITSAEIYDRKGYLNEKGYKALEEIALQRMFVKMPHLIQDVRMVRSNYCPNCGRKMKGRFVE